MRTTLKTFIALFFLVNTAFAQVPGNVPTNGLKAWWSFTGNGNDLSLNGNDLTNNGATLTSDRNNNANSAYAFSGTNQYLTEPAPSFTFGSDSSFTVSFWMRKTINSYGIALMNSSSANGNFIWLLQTGTAGDVKFGTNKQGSSWTWASSTYTLNTWELFVATYNNGSMTLYKNGVSAGTATYTHTGANTINLPLNIGRGHNPNYLTGDLDDIGIWNRVLTQAEIDLLFLNCSAEVTLQPSNDAAVVGGNVQFGIEGSKAGLDYQWQSDGSGSFQDLTNNTVYQGADTDTLDVSAVTANMDGEKFRCIVSDSTLCHDTSSTAMLNVCGSLTSQPTDKTTPVNSTVKFGVSSNDPNANYQWQISTGSSFIDLVNNNFYTGTTSDTLTLSPATMLFNSKQYRCVLETSVCFDTSTIATLTVADNIGINESRLSGCLVYPNPAKDVLNITIKKDLLDSKFRVLNTMGQVVYNGTLKSEESKIDISGLPNGHYFLWIEDKARLSFTIVD